MVHWTVKHRHKPKLDVCLIFDLQELETKTKQSKKMLQQLERQAHEGTSQIKQLENALRMCNNEIQTYIDALEESKELFDREIAQRDDKVGFIVLYC